MSKIFQYGMYYIQVAKVDSEGYPMGTAADPDTVAQDTTLHSYVHFNPVDFNHATPTYTQWTDQGGQKIRAQARGGVEALGEGTFTLSEFDNTFHALVAKTAVDSTAVTDWEVTPGNYNNTFNPKFAIIASMKGQVINETTGQTSDKWSHWVYPSVYITATPPNASQAGGVNPQTSQYTFTPTYSGRRVDGRTFLAANTTVVNGREAVYHMKTDYPVAVTTYIKDGTETSFVLGYRPIATTATGAADNSITGEGVTLPVTSVTVATGAVVLAAATTAGDKVVVMYETEFTAI